ncbi:MAG: MBL fold metallo-hydrolase [Oscillospiraceae bacterium]|jgi:glyoxylase-like metal-dependent hydrolase (beta-lactamase superfamily II)|nr:MBL fold metallo-hydrolase [Oscillospiraceae bacterium]
MAYEVVSIGDRAWRIEDEMVRCFLFEGTSAALLVDTGVSGGALCELVDSLTDKPIYLVNTHADADHIGANAQFKRTHMFPAEFMYYAQNEVSYKTPALPLWDGEDIDIGGRRFEIIVIPGHTYGSIALLDRANRLLIAGDSISATPIFLFGAQRSLPAFIASMEKLTRLASAFDTILPSHGDCPVPASQLGAVKATAEALARGELTPQDPPFPLPAKLYTDGAAAFFAD